RLLTVPPRRRPLALALPAALPTFRRGRGRAACKYAAFTTQIRCVTAVRQASRGFSPRSRSPQQRSASRRHPPKPSTSAATRCSRSEEHTSELQSREKLVCRPLLEK